MRYVVMDIRGTDWFTTECETEEAAIKEAERQFNQLSEHDRKKRDMFYVLESVNPDEDADDHFDGNEVRRWI